MCASLVDKIPNLGGLARTSEVFSATAIAIPYGRVRSVLFRSVQLIGAIGGVGSAISAGECECREVDPVA